MSIELRFKQGQITNLKGSCRAVYTGIEALKKAVFVNRALIDRKSHTDEQKARRLIKLVPLVSQSDFVDSNCNIRKRENVCL